MAYLVTGVAGFIGFHVSRALLAQGIEVIGVDNVNAYYEVPLKEARIAILEGTPGFVWRKADIADRAAIQDVIASSPTITKVIHLAAQAGVGHSLQHPFDYTRINVEGQMVMLELVRHMQSCEHFLYASSSSVYGTNTKHPFAVGDPTDSPASIYAASKKACELMAHSYGHLYGVPSTGLRFFSVYGPWGRPDMVMFLFTRAILAGKPIRLFNGGDMVRDFTYIDDIVRGVLALTELVPSEPKIYNIGNNRPEPLIKVVALLESELGAKAEIEVLPMQPGDVKETFADIDPLIRDTGIRPERTLEYGIPQFVRWYRSYYGV